MRGEFLSLVASSLLKTIANYNPASVRWPAVEDNHGRSFRSSGNDLKQHLSGGLRHRHLRHLVDDDQFVFRPPLGDPIEFTVVLGFDQFVHHLGRGGETHSLPLPARVHRQSGSQVSLARSCFPKKNDRLTALQIATPQ